MRKQIFLLSIILAHSSLFAQIPSTGAENWNFTEFLKTDLNVVLTGNKDVDEPLKSAFDEFWKLNAVHFITQEEFDDSVRDRSKFFFAPFKVTTQRIDGETEKVEHERIDFTWALTSGGWTKPDDISPIYYMYVILVSRFHDETIYSMSYRFNAQIKLMNDAMTKIRDEKAKISSSSDGMKFMERYFVNPQELKRMKLLIDEGIVQPEDFNKSESYSQNQLLTYKASAGLEEIQKAYPYNFEVVSQERIRQALDEREEGVAVISCVAFTNRVIHIFEASTLDCIYFKADVMGLSMKGKHYKELVKEMER